MLKLVNRKSLAVSAAFVTGMMTAMPAHANNFSSIAKNVNESISSVPGLLSGVAYMFGILLGVLGILKIKDHVENPAQTHLKDGAIRLAAGGALFALPIVFESMLETVDQGQAGANATTASVNKVSWNVN